MSSPWVFEQLETPKGSNGPKTLKLANYAAPFGRPRQKPVIKDKLTVRNQVVRYPGNSKAPTRHFFGTHREPSVLTGRWMDSNLGVGEAKNLVAAWDDFIDDQVLCRISWGDNLSYTGFIESLETEWESPAQVAWTMNLLLDEKDTSNVRVAVPALSLDQSTSQLQKVLADLFPGIDQPQGFSPDPAWSPDLQDSVDQIVSDIAQFSANLNNVIGQLSNLESATFFELQRFRSAIHGIKTAVLQYEAITDNLRNDTALFVRQADSDIAWFTFTSNEDIGTTTLYAILADMELDAEKAQRGKTTLSYVAIQGDTWESISTQFYDSPSGANKIRQANGVQFGALPQAGKTYQIPFSP
jgi:hypothetical protein